MTQRCSVRTCIIHRALKYLIKLPKNSNRLKILYCINKYCTIILQNPKTGRALTLKNETLVKTFYERDDISWMIPGMKECENEGLQNSQNLDFVTVFWQETVVLIMCVFVFIMRMSSWCWIRSIFSIFRGYWRDFKEL